MLLSGLCYFRVLGCSQLAQLCKGLWVSFQACRQKAPVNLRSLLPLLTSTFFTASGPTVEYYHPVDFSAWQGKSALIGLSLFFFLTPKTFYIGSLFLLLSVWVIQAFSFHLVRARVKTNFFYKGPESKYFRLCGPQTALFAYLCLFFIAF